MRRLISLGWSHWAVVASGVATVLIVAWIAFMPSWQELYVREFALPRLGHRYGFEFGSVTFTRDHVAYAWSGIVSIDPGGDLARLGMRSRDMPLEYHGNGATVMYEALMAGERGQAATFEVLNADDWSAGRNERAFRTIHVSPRTRPR